MLIGNTVALTAFEPGDRDPLFRWINSPELVRFNAPFRPVNAAMHDAWFAALGRDASRVAFAIRALPQHQLIGVVQLLEIDPIHRNAEALIRIGEVAEQGRGRGTETLKLLLDYAWRDLNLHRVWSRAFARNPRAVAAYCRAGFVEEGRMRQAAFIDGAWDDIVVLGALAPSATA